ncbi:hypothetical protein EAI_11784 [Harpegnathos saltator]|uniref:Uncharacterized protein n=1 Tax=Harpegnathos saltator TaxID=610380 RepID=E2B5M2_HARSA|nr:hypothetical protein EAI_11784 [Harpegnathos saltator]
MSRSVVVPLVLLALSQAAFATTVDVSKTKTVELQFTDEDIVPKTELKNLVPQTYANGFIGDLEIGSRLRDETIFQRIIVFNNPTDYVQSSELKVNGPGIVHYINAQNFQGSYAVVCDHSDALGSSRIYLTIRVNPQTKSLLLALTRFTTTSGGSLEFSFSVHTEANLEKNGTVSSGVVPVGTRALMRRSI